MFVINFVKKNSGFWYTEFVYNSYRCRLSLRIICVCDNPSSVLQSLHTNCCLVEVNKMAGPTSTAARDIVLEIEDDTDLKLEIKNQMELTADEIEDTDEIKKKKHMARNALTLWQEKLKNLGEARCQLRLAISSSLSEVYQLGSLYSVFAGVVLTAVATSQRLQCQHLWIPVGLCLFTYCIIVTITYKKFRHISKLERIKDDVKQESRVSFHHVRN